MKFARALPAILLLGLLAPAPTASALPCVDLDPRDPAVTTDDCSTGMCRPGANFSVCASRSSNGQVTVYACAWPVGCTVYLVIEDW